MVRGIEVNGKPADDLHIHEFTGLYRRQGPGKVTRYFAPCVG